jgi:Zn-dependent protease
LPFPPLDGSNVMKSILPNPFDTIYIALEPLFIILFVIFLITGQLGIYIKPLIEFVIIKMAM